MPRVRCPRCATVIDVEPGARPVCPTCGFGREQAAPATVAPTGQAPEYGRTHAYQQVQPAAPPGVHAPDGRTPGRVRHPAVVMLLAVLTLGIYLYFWYWMTGDEVDRFRPDARAGSMLRPAVIMGLVSGALMVLAMVFFFGAFFSLFDPDTGISDDALTTLLVGSIGAFLLMLLAAGLGLVGSVFTYVGLWRVWTVTASEQTHLGMRPVQPGVLLLLLLSPYVIQFFGGFLALIPFVGPFLVIAVLIASVAAVVVAYVLTQSGLNQVWRAYGAPS